MESADIFRVLTARSSFRIGRGIGPPLEKRGFQMRSTTIKVAVTLIAVITAMLGSASPSGATSGWKWAQNSDLGYMGQNIHGSGKTVDYIDAKFVPPSRDFFTGRTWRFHITTYSCDPRGKDRSSAGCQENSARWNSTTRTGNPPKAGSTCQSLGIDGTGVQDCQDYGLATVSTSDGGFPTFGTGSKTFSSGTWICTEIQKKDPTTGSWLNIGGNPNTGKGLRACAEVLA